MIPATHSVIVMLTKQHRKFLFRTGRLFQRELGQRTGVIALLGMETHSVLPPGLEESAFRDLSFGKAPSLALLKKRISG